MIYKTCIRPWLGKIDYGLNILWSYLFYSLNLVMINVMYTILCD